MNELRVGLLSSFHADFPEDEPSCTMYRFPLGLLLALSCFVIAGCGAQDIASSDIAGAQAAYDAGKTKIEDGDYTAAMPLLVEALQQPGLDPDQASKAMLYRSICHSSAGDVDAAEADIAEAELGGPSEALLLFAKAFVAEAKGNASEAAKLFKNARRLDPTLKKP